MTDAFARDNEWQMDIRNRILGPGFYASFCTRYVFLDKGGLTSILQRKFAVDTIAQKQNGDAISIEEKIVRFPKSGVPYDAFALETHSCTVEGHESDGWMVYGQADRLLYCFAQSPDPVYALRCYLIDFPALKNWFWAHVEAFSPFGPLETLNRTRGRVVPIAQVERSGVRMWMRDIRDPGHDIEATLDQILARARP